MGLPSWYRKIGRAFTIAAALQVGILSPGSSRSWLGWQWAGLVALVCAYSYPELSLGSPSSGISEQWFDDAGVCAWRSKSHTLHLIVVVHGTWSERVPYIGHIHNVLVMQWTGTGTEPPLCYGLPGPGGRVMLFTRGQFWPSGIVIACVCGSVCPCVCMCVCINHELVCTITHRPFKLGSPNLDQRCKTPWFGSLLFLGMIDLDLQGQI